MKNISIKLLGIVVLIATFSSLGAYAQSPFKKFGLGKKGGGGDIDVEKVGDELVIKYVKVHKAIGKVTSIQAKAMGLGDLAEKYETLNNNMSNVPAKKELQKSVKLGDELLEEMEKRDVKIEDLSEEKKKEIAKSIPPFIAAIVEAKDLPQTAKNWADAAKSEMKGLGALKLRNKLAVPLYIVPKIPKDIANWFKVSKTLVTFAKANGVEIKDEKELSKFKEFQDN